MTADRDSTYLMLDSTIVRAHQAHDITAAADLLEGQTAKAVLADKA
jgi:hypothetical protein